MSNRPIISVLLPTYNMAAYLGRAIDSILAQTYPHFELIVLDDGSTDYTADVLARYDDPRLIIQRNECNLGYIPTLNNGLKTARGTYIARQDADDISLPERFAAQVAYLQAHPDVGLLGSQIAYADRQGKLIETAQPLHDDALIMWDLLFGSAMAHSSVMFRRALIEQVGDYDLQYLYAEDRELWLRMAQVCSVRRLSDTLVYIFRSPEGVSRRYKTQQQANQNQIGSEAMTALLGQPISPTEAAHFRQILLGERLAKVEIGRIHNILSQLYTTYRQANILSPHAQQQLATAVADYYYIMAGSNLRHAPIQAGKALIKAFKIAPRYPRWETVAAKYEQGRATIGRQFVDISKPDALTIVAGMGRSGTTWVSDIINHDQRQRLLFEPFVPQSATPFLPYQYLAPTATDAALHKKAANLLTGAVRDDWVDRATPRFIYRKRILKEISVNLMLGWLQRVANCPPTVLVVRHPLQVVLGWRKLGWGFVWGGNRPIIDCILSQETLLVDFPIISNMAAQIDKHDFLENTLFLWCVLHLVPAAHAQNVHVIYYENLLHHFQEEVTRLFRYLDRPKPRTLTEIEYTFSSTNFQARDVVHDRARLFNTWREAFSAEQINRANAILAAFDLDHLYDANGYPTGQPLIRS